VVCSFCHDEGRVVEETPVKPAAKSKKVQKSVATPIEASPDPYTPPKFDAAAAKANPQAELAARTLARRHLLPFIKRFRPKYDAGWVHKDICRRLERFLRAVEAGEEPRLLLMCPPRMGKSEIGSRHFTPWVLGQHPDWEIIAASHTTSLSLSFSRYIRDLLRDPAYHAVFSDAVLDPQSQSTENWNLTEGGGYLAAGVGSAITGRGAHILILDDLVKDIEAADSQLQCDATWEWYISTAHSRLAPGGGVLGIMTWWSENDWAGRIQQVMAGGEGEQFEIVRYPAINEVGDEYILADDTIVEIPPGAPVPVGATMTRPHNTAVHPARYSTAALLRKKANYIAAGMKRMWDALYQQNPTPDEGIFFGKDMFRLYAHRPDRRGRYVYQAWDFAITEGESNDWTVGTTLLQDEYDNLYVLDVLRFRSDDSIEITEIIIDYHLQWESTLLGFEDGQIWKTLRAQFEKRCHEREVYPSYELLVPLTDKKARAMPLKGRMQHGKVYFPQNASWFPALQREMLRFPAGKNDDQVDSLAWAVRLTLSKSAPKLAEPKKLESWRDKLGQYIDGGRGGHMAA
jgi:predicted phage terminase large subunit-like protein